MLEVTSPTGRVFPYNDITATQSMNRERSGFKNRNIVFLGKTHPSLVSEACDFAHRKLRLKEEPSKIDPKRSDFECEVEGKLGELVFYMEAPKFLSHPDTDVYLKHGDGDIDIRAKDGHTIQIRTTKFFHGDMKLGKIEDIAKVVPSRVYILLYHSFDKELDSHNHHSFALLGWCYGADILNKGEIWEFARNKFTHEPVPVPALLQGELRDIQEVLRWIKGIAPLPPCPAVK
jgi:hypothetical protein